MKNSHSSLFCLFTFLCLCLSLNLEAQTTLTYYNQSFVIDTLFPATGSAGMNSPWEVLYGPDDSLPQPGVYILRLFSGIGAPVLIQKVLVE